MINSITHILVQSIYTQFLTKILGEDWFGDYEVSICKLGYSLWAVIFVTMYSYTKQIFARITWMLHVPLSRHKVVALANQ